MRRFDAVIFDMDGTLIEPLLDLVTLRQELGIAPQDKVLHAIESMRPDLRQRATERLLEEELAAATHASLMPKAAEVIAVIRDAGLKVALLTNNHQQAMDAVLRRFSLEFDLAWSRESGPTKPEPDGIVRACEMLSVVPDRTAVVGDFLYDVAAANAAGACSVLLARWPRPAFAADACCVISSLVELLGVLEIEHELLHSAEGRIVPETFFQP